MDIFFFSTKGSLEPSCSTLLSSLSLSLAEGVTAHLVAAAHGVDRPAVVKVNVVGPQP